MKNYLLALAVLTTTQSWSHGEDKPGPHGGTIAMPGAFHAEAVYIKEQQIKIYLLDMEWKNPTITDSSVALTYGPETAKCISKKDHFVCDFSKTVNLSKAGTLTVVATRKKQIGNSFTYTLPLKN